MASRLNLRLMVLPISLNAMLILLSPWSAEAGKVVSRKAKKASAAVVNIKTMGAIGDGIHDDTGAIREAIRSLPEKGGTVFFPVGTYLISGSGISLEKSNMTFLGESWGSIILAGNLGKGRVFYTSGNRPNLSKITFRKLNFKYPDVRQNTRFPAVEVGHGARDVTVDRCYFMNLRGIGLLSNQANDITVKDSVFMSPGDARGTGLHFNGPAGNIKIRNNAFNYLRQGVTIASSREKPIRDILVENNSFDLGWWTIKALTSGEGQGVTYTDSSVTDLHASLPAFANPATGSYPHNVRVMPLRQKGNGSYANNVLSDPNARFRTNQVMRGEIVRVGSAFGVVLRVISETELEVEGWQSNTNYRTVTRLRDGSEYRVFGIYHGLIKSNTTQEIDLFTSGTGGWMDLNGNAVTPAPGTRYEVLVEHPVYPLHISKGSVNLTVKDNTFKKGWADQISTYDTTDAVITGNLIQDGEDTGITVKEALRAYVANNTIIHQGAQGSYFSATDSVFENNTVRDTQWTAVNNPIVADLVVRDGVRNIIRNNTIERTASQGKYGILVYARERNTIDNQIFGNIVQGHLDYDIYLRRVQDPDRPSYYVSSTLLCENTGMTGRVEDIGTIDFGAGRCPDD